MEKITDIIESIANEKNLDLESVKDKVIVALINTAKKVYGQEYDFFVDNKSLKLYQKITVIADNDERLDENNESFIALSKARKEAGEVEVGDELTYECSLENLGRTAVNILHKELEYHIQKLLEQTIFDKYKNKVGQIVFGNVVRIDSEENTYIEIDELRAFLPRKNRIKGEKFKIGDVVKAVIRRVYIDKGIKIELSRTSPKFLERLLESEVPEIKDGYVSIQNCARIPGERAKVVLTTNMSNIDPVGATVGVKGVRINAVSKELHNENIDCIEYSNEIEILIARALAPAIISSVKIKDQKAIVSLNNDQKSKAIGRNGINIRLVSMLSSCEIELNVLDSKNNESAAEAFKNLENLFKNV
ncbi:transcription termination/antitermination protein NusA [Campylobacter novaezeelandiae]|uniref:Transcription termination/antitermination protein NusA n=1 Tax=Campylobacter novaezeelandiae TaxID=2267891 RepID=A0A4Q9JUR5_9BACT|nr:transcription termination factor NusA [Campylobacter novaezeelandiae]QWU79834.1 transcription termination factor [Campylobacter novaezeelandiae]TBR78002.1 transcription termination/antitermination protein NusA [Campylobacter novaezeelandiae]TBR81478.1 transcription termination/antitermination protein NusA [Campylobacter novaezeelandiae]